MKSDAKRAKTVASMEDENNNTTSSMVELETCTDTDVAAAIAGEISQEIILKAVPVTFGQSVQKLECCLSFEDQKTPGGVFVDVIDKRSFGASFVMTQHELTGHRVFVRIQKIPKPVAIDEPQAADQTEVINSDSKVTVLGLGVEGGFGDVGKNGGEGEDDNDDDDKFDEIVSLVLFPERVQILYPVAKESKEKNEDQGQELQRALVLDDARTVIDSILSARDSERSSDVAAFVVDDDDRKVSKYAKDLPQLDNGVKISHNPDDWVCAESGMKENLWLNLSTGHIGSGRRQFDGSGGTGAALKHYNDTGKRYPLCVKLGTITENGASADVYSYAEDEDDLVIDPKLTEHLAHWGLDPKSLKKTEKSMEEMNLDLNQKFEFALIQEEGQELVPLSGPGLTGLINLGNSCYMSSVLQCLFHLPYHQQRYAPDGNDKNAKDMARQIYKDVVNGLYVNSTSNPWENFLIQSVKLADALCHGRPATENSSTPSDSKKKRRGVVYEKGRGVAPRAIKSIVGKGHHEFSTGRQQDAVEYFQHFLEFEQRHERKLGEHSKGDPALQFNIGVEDRVMCNTSGKVKYKKRHDNILSLFVPMDAMTNKKEVDEFEEMRAAKEALGERVDPKDVVRPRVPLQACIDSFAQPEIIEDFYSPATKSKTTATKTTKVDSFPDVIAINIRRFIVDGVTWEPKKLDVEIIVPDEIDLEWLRGTGLQQGEEELPEDEDQDNHEDSDEVVSAPKKPQANAEIVTQLSSMGFPPNRCEKAAVFTNNSGVEAAMEWLLMHMEDPDIDEPMTTEASSGRDSNGTGSNAASNSEHVQTLVALGFSEKAALVALRQTGGNNPERAADWLLSRSSEELEKEMESTEAQDAKEEDGGGAAGSHAPPALRDGPAKYRLHSFISHMGSNTHSGHYVCHIRMPGVNPDDSNGDNVDWVIFNDSKVGLSRKPPLGYGYIYFFKRIASTATNKQES